MWADGTVRTETADIVPSEGPTTNRDAEQDEESNVLGASVASTTMEGVGTAEETDEVVNVSATGNGDGEDRRVARLTNAQVVLDREKWVAMKGDLGRASVELVRMDVYAALLNKSKIV